MKKEASGSRRFPLGLLQLFREEATWEIKTQMRPWHHADCLVVAAARNVMLVLSSALPCLKRPFNSRPSDVSSRACRSPS